MVEHIFGASVCCVRSVCVCVRFLFLLQFLCLLYLLPQFSIRLAQFRIGCESRPLGRLFSLFPFGARIFYPIPITLLAMHTPRLCADRFISILRNAVDGRGVSFMYNLRC